MQFFRVFFLCLSVLIAVPAQAAEADGDAVRQKAFGAETFTLSNGMRAVVIPNHRVPVVTHMVWYGVGAADEPWGHSGLAHFLEHMMFKGTKTVGPGEFSRRVKALGGNENAFTSQDFTSYFQSVAVENLEKVMRLEADRMQNLAFNEKDFDSEHQVVMEERRQRTDNDPTGPFFEQMKAVLFPNHPYGIPVIGWMDEMKIMDRDRMMNFYRTWYAPNNAILVVSGDITAAQLKPMAETIYGTIPAHKVPERHWPAVPPLPADIRMEMRSPQIHKVSVVRLYRVPGSGESKQDKLALQLLNTIMSDGRNSRLYKTLVVDKKIADSVSMSYDGTALSDSMLQISVTPAEGVSPQTAEKAVDAVLRDTAKNGISAQEMKDAIGRLEDGYSFSRDSIQGPAMEFGQGLSSGETVDDIEYWASDIAALSAEQVTGAARRFLDPDNPERQRWVTGYILPAQETGESRTEAAP